MTRTNAKIWAPRAINYCMSDLQDFRNYLEATTPDQWQLQTVSSADHRKNCLFGHLLNWAYRVASDLGAPHEEADTFSALMFEWFEEKWLTTYVVYRVNDGDNPKYPQLEARDRCIALLNAVLDGTEMRTWDSIEQELGSLLED